MMPFKAKCMVKFTERALTLFFLLFFLTPAAAFADEEASNRAYVTASEYGQFYAKSVPHESYGLKGVTRVYRVGEDEDTLIQSYGWYSTRIFIEGFGDTVYVVQMGPWHRGRRATATDHAVAFYKGERLLKKHSTLDIAGEEGNVSSSVSHYTVFSGKPVFRRPFAISLYSTLRPTKAKPFPLIPKQGFSLAKRKKKLKNSSMRPR